MTKLITVHGTNAGDQSDEGERWWQKNSSFQKRLAEWLNLDGVEIEPLHWYEGPNSEVERRKAGRKLLTKLKEHEATERNYFLIGHSHGGSVICHALILAASEGLSLPRLRSWLTIGTPFLSTKPRWLLFSRLDNFGKLAYLSMMLLFIITYWLEYEEGSLTNGMILLALSIIPFFGAIILSIVIWLTQRQFRQYHAAATRHQFNISFLSRWRSLRSRHDEAINALATTARLNLRLFRQTLLIEPATTSIVFLFSIAVVAGLFVIFKFAWLHMDDISSLSGTWYRSGIDKWSISNLLFMLQYNSDEIIAGFFVALLLGLFGLIPLFFIVRLLAYLLGMPTSHFLNWLAANQMRRNAFGNDTVGERMTRVSGVLEGSAPNFGLVPDEIETILSAFSDKHAVKTLESVRHVLGLNQETGGTKDVAKIMAEQMSWQELIHTAYFDVDEFAKLIAYVLHKAGLAPLGESFKADRDFEKIKSAYDQMSPLVVANH
jgi:hypothetical protein